MKHSDIDLAKLRTDRAYWNKVAPEGATHYNNGGITDISRWRMVQNGDFHAQFYTGPNKSKVWEKIQPPLNMNYYIPKP